ncbi:MAG: PAS domain S-box protein [Deltaproteobacteria bacterium]|nr:PAS domain S-box protein [Deltaproteobacteria bacterium]
MNRSCERMFGYGAGELAGLNVSILMPSPFREEHDGYIARYLRTGEKRVIESRREVVARRKDGTLFPAELAVSEVRLGEKRLFSGMITDISERKEREAEMRRTLSLLGATLESTADGILVVDLGGKIVSCNQKFAELWRIPAEALSDHDDNRALASAHEQLTDPEAFLAKVRDLYAHPEAESRDVLKFKDGRIFERYSKPQRIGESIVGRVWSFSDLTEQRKLEAQLRQSQKMEALGTLAGGVAHDFNNILTAIIGFSNLLQMNMEESDPRRQHLNQILAAAERATGLTQSLLAYSRNKPLNPGRVNLNEIVRKVGNFLSRLIGEDVELTITVADEALNVMADDGQIEQVLMNLATNARDAMAGEGSLIIRTGPIELDQEFVSSHGYGITGRYALVSVSDTGSGMDRQTAERIFEPFFTTKQMGRGTGLGLSIVYGIVKQHNGYINVYSEVGKGTTFNIYFPLTEVAEKEQNAVDMRHPKGGIETILHVEDSEDIRALMREVLTGAGYTVIEAVDGQDGVEKFREHREEVQLLILDVIMPRKNGKEVYDEVRAMKGDIKCIFTSGYTADIISRKGILEEGYNFVTKPLSPNALLAKVREVLDGESPPARG